MMHVLYIPSVAGSDMASVDVSIASLHLGSLMRQSEAVGSEGEKLHHKSDTNFQDSPEVAPAPVGRHAQSVSITIWVSHRTVLCLNHDERDEN